MRLTISTTVMPALAALLLLAGCAAPGAGTASVNSNASQTANSAPPPTAPAAPTATQANSDGVTRISVAETRAALDAGQAVVVDVRDNTAYKSGHIKGSLAIPGDEIANHLDQLPKGKRIITYCS